MAQYYPYGLVIVGLGYFIGKIAQIHIHLTYIIMFYAATFKVNEDITFQDCMVKDQIDMISVFPYMYRVLFTDKSEPFSQFKKKFLYIDNQSFLKT